MNLNTNFHELFTNCFMNYYFTQNPQNEKEFLEHELHESGE